MPDVAETAFAVEYMEQHSPPVESVYQGGGHELSRARQPARSRPSLTKREIQTLCREAGWSSGFFASGRRLRSPEPPNPVHYGRIRTPVICSITAWKEGRFSAPPSVHTSRPELSRGRRTKWSSSASDAFAP